LTNGKKIEVEYDEIKDVIVLNGQIYLPVKNSEQSKGGEFPKNLEEINYNLKVKNSAHGEEELAHGGQFWFYIFMVFCKTYI
jgi:hypothetical protein